MIRQLMLLWLAWLVSIVLFRLGKHLYIYI